MTTKDNNNSSVNTGVWQKTPYVIGIILLVLASYEMGIGHARFKKRSGEYVALRTQYDRIKEEYSALKAQHDRLEIQCSALMAQYERIERQNRTRRVHE